MLDERRKEEEDTVCFCHFLSQMHVSGASSCDLMQSVRAAAGSA